MSAKITTGAAILLNYSFSDIVLTFFAYAVLGWCIEVVVMAIHTGRFNNRGFLNGPLCPIYGYGVLIVLWLLTPFRNNIFILF